MTAPSRPDVVAVAERLLVEINKAVARWTKHHKYSNGEQLCAQAMVVAEAAHMFWRDKKGHMARLNVLDQAVAGLKLRLQLCKLVEAYASFAQFNAFIVMAEDLGNQVGRLKHYHSKGQSPAPASPQRESAKTLSAHPASAEANS